PRLRLVPAELQSQRPPLRGSPYYAACPGYGIRSPPPLRPEPYQRRNIRRLELRPLDHRRSASTPAAVPRSRARRGTPPRSISLAACVRERAPPAPHSIRPDLWFRTRRCRCATPPAPCTRR